MIEHISDKDTLLTVTDRACHPAVVTVDALGQIGCKLFNVSGGFAGLLKHLIPIGRALGKEGIDCLFSAFRFFCR